ncbi:MAG: nitrite/sulfite reductase [Rubrivivax sp.]|nr:nitrite/sulfite reductase [Rubrivivax sp.]MCA3258794.1 nitrite/sulfite reductase [Rubrivivax sp.]MCZ8030369.1 nitrite/sulfite reductase [Rubrivivax sp.]
MYRHTDLDRRFVHARAAQYRDQLDRHLRGELSADDFRPLRLQNGWYVQRHAPMLRVAIPYGVLSARQLRQLARIAREFDLQDAGRPTERGGFGHFTTRQNLQFNWILLERSADVMDLLAEVDMHGIQTSGNCVRNVTTDVLAGVAPDEIADPRPWCEILRQWSTLHPEFAFLPRKFKIAVSGSREDRAATGWHDIGLKLVHDDDGALGFAVDVGGGMGRTPVIATRVAEFVPAADLLLFVEAILRVYNRFGRRDNLYKARIKILVRAEGERFVQAVRDEYRAIVEQDGGWISHRLGPQQIAGIAAHFAPPAGVAPGGDDAVPDGPPAYRRWLERNTHGHRLPGWRAVTLSLKRPGLPPGDATADQMDAAAALAERFGHGELRVSHEQNLLLPWVRARDLPALWQAAVELGLGRAHTGMLTDLIACPGGDLCALANARSIPIAAAIAERWSDLDEVHDIGDVALHISGCINSCGHHHSGHIGILGVDKDGSEWYQVTLGGSDGRLRSGPAQAGKMIGPAFAADEVPDALEAIVETYRGAREPGELFVHCVRRLGLAPFRAAADAVRRTTARAALETEPVA